MPIVIPDLSGIGTGIESGASALAGALEKKAERRLQQGNLDNMLSAMEQQGGDVGTLAAALRENKVSSEMAMPLLQQAYKAQMSEKKPSAFQKKMEAGAADAVVSGLEAYHKSQNVAGQIDRLKELKGELTGGPDRDWETTASAAPASIFF